MARNRFASGALHDRWAVLVPCLSHAWRWLTGTGYRPERHYMRGPREPVGMAAPGRVPQAGHAAA